MQHEVDLTAPRLACLRCKGVGTTHHDAFDYHDPRTGIVKSYAARDEPCNACDASGWFTPPDVKDILTRIVASKGKNKGHIRASFPSPGLPANATAQDRAVQVKNERAYYVWRLGRFHGGKDTSMPMTASLFSRGDPYIAILDAMATMVAKRAFGTDMAAASQWGKAMLGDAYKGPDPLDVLLGKG